MAKLIIINGYLFNYLFIYSFIYLFNEIIILISNWNWQITVLMCMSYSHSVPSNSWAIQKQSKTVFMSESLNHRLTWFSQMAASFRNKARLSLWVSHWIIDSLDSLKWLLHSETKQVVTVFMNESLNHRLTWFVQTVDSYSNESLQCYVQRCSSVLIWLELAKLSRTDHTDNGRQNEVFLLCTRMQWWAVA